MVMNLFGYLAAPLLMDSEKSLSMCVLWSLVQSEAFGGKYQVLVSFGVYVAVVYVDSCMCKFKVLIRSKF